MGKPYAFELGQLEETYAWAMGVSVDSLASWLASAANYPLLVVGSGGSLTTAYVASFLHQLYSRQLAKAVTPLDILGPSSRNCAVLFVSASGSNPDIVGAFQHVAVAEPRQLAVACMHPGSPLAQKASQYGISEICEWDPPFGKDGFLATNSLLAMSVLLARGYAAAWSTPMLLPEQFGGLVRTVSSLADGTLSTRCAALWERDTLVALYSTPLQAAAMDLESKFTEAALGTVQLADYRNFAHGRHHWLAKRAYRSAVLAIANRRDTWLADRTLEELPPQIPRVRIEVSGDDTTACVSALVTVLHIVQMAGTARGIDPGRPGVPRFGSRIFNLRAFARPSASQMGLSRNVACAIRRKTGEDVDILAIRGELEYWRRAYQKFRRALQMSTFRALVLDYDGTLCDPRDRFRGISSELAGVLNHFLQANVALGVATGRGKSVRTDLRRVLPRDLWGRVVVGYYNGAEVAQLDDDLVPSENQVPSSTVQLVARALTDDPVLTRMATWDVRHSQVSVITRCPGREQYIWERVRAVVECTDVGMSALRSSHSVDVLKAGVSKLSVVRRVEELAGGQGTALRIGDRGAWPGNDYELLATWSSLSVDEVPGDPITCWNLAPAGHRGTQATLGYLKSACIRDGEFAMVLRGSSALAGNK